MKQGAKKTDALESSKQKEKHEATQAETQGYIQTETQIDTQVKAQTYALSYIQADTIDINEAVMTGETSYSAPRYVQLRELIRSRVEEGEYLPGTKIPSENELAKQFGMNRLTVRNAISALLQEGVLRSVQGKGVFVLGKKVQRDLENLSGFTKTMMERNSKPSTKVLFKKKRPAGAKYGRIFNIPEEEEIYHVRRVCFGDGEPVSLEDIFIPGSLIPSFENINLSQFSIYDIYEFHNIELHRAWQTLSITNLDPKDARTLRIDPEQGVLLFECTSTDSTGTVVEFSRNFTRGDKCSFHVHFSKNERT